MIEINWTIYYNNKLPVGTKVKLRSETQKYTVQSSNICFAIVSKPFNPQKTVLYTIIDFWKNIRWPEDLIFWLWAETKEQCEEMLERLTQWETEVSERRSIELDIEYIILPLE